MSTEQATTAQDQELLEEPIEETPDDDEPSEAAVTLGSWAISITMHALILLICAFIVYYAAQPHEQAPVRMVTIEPPAEPPTPPEKRDIVESKQTNIEADTEVENPIVTNLDLPVDKTMTEDEVQTENPMPKGREEAVSTSELGGTGAFMAIGAGGGGAGMFGNRSGGGKRRAIGRFGGSRGSENAVEATLRWFARHQSPNGQWDVDQYPQNCTLPGAKCEPGTGHTGIDGDTASTGYAVLCFLGAGYDHRTPNKWRKVVKSGLDWLVSVQTAEGLIGKRNYENAICAMALAEAYGMTNDPALREPAQRAVNVILARQTRRGGAAAPAAAPVPAPGKPAQPPTGDSYTEASDRLAWDYVSPNMGRNDSSVSGWNVMALKSAKAAGLDVSDGLAGARNWLELTWKATNPNWAALDPYTGESKFPYTYNPSANAPGGHHEIVGVGLVGCVFLGYESGNVMMETLANYANNKQTPKAWPCAAYYMYYNTIGIFQVGGERWKKWNESVRDMLVNSQRKGEDCFDGSWDSQGAGWGNGAGRLIITAYACLSLEVYYRYLPLNLKNK